MKQPNPTRTFLRLAACLAIAGAWPLAATAQSDYPSKPIKLVSPFPAGGTSDVMARMLAEEMAKQLKQPVLVENIGGAGGVVGTDRALKAAADGYTLIQTGVGQNAVAHGLDPTSSTTPSRTSSTSATCTAAPTCCWSTPASPTRPWPTW